GVGEELLHEDRKDREASWALRDLCVLPVENVWDQVGTLVLKRPGFRDRTLPNERSPGRARPPGGPSRRPYRSTNFERPTGPPGGRALPQNVVEARYACGIVHRRGRGVGEEFLHEDRKDREASWGLRDLCVLPVENVWERVGTLVPKRLGFAGIRAPYVHATAEPRVIETIAPTLMRAGKVAEPLRLRRNVKPFCYIAAAVAASAVGYGSSGQTCMLAVRSR